jgi:hypothetical protein
MAHLAFRPLEYNHLLLLSLAAALCVVQTLQHMFGCERDVHVCDAIKVKLKLWSSGSYEIGQIYAKIIRRDSEQNTLCVHRWICGIAQGFTVHIS